MAGLELRGNVDLATAGVVGGRLLRAIDELPDDRVVVDCSELGYIDSTGIKMLVELQRDSGTTLVLRGLDRQHRRLFTMTGLDEVFEYTDA